MDAEIKRKWVAALRSGDYEQGDCQLKKRVRSGRVQHCCLGVLSEIAGREERFENGTYVFGPKGDVAYLDKDFLDEVGLTGEMEGRLAYFNDNGRSFNWIAAYIDRHL